MRTHKANDKRLKFNYLLGHGEWTSLNANPALCVRTSIINETKAKIFPHNNIAVVVIVRASDMML